jgi:hypothetical protein
VQGLMPGLLGGLVESLRRNAMLSLIGLMIAWQVFDVVYQPAFGLLLRLLHPGITYG